MNRFPIMFWAFVDSCGKGGVNNQLAKIVLDIAYREKYRV